MSAKILLVDDEAAIADLVEVYLTNEGYTVYKCENAAQALECVEQKQVDLAILDVMLPDLSGFELCRRIRQKHLWPILMLTARVEDLDKIQGLMLGADDYITKPFSPAELLARVDAIHRRVTMMTGKAASGDIVSGPFVLNQRSRTLTKNGQLIDLTQVEFQIMELFLKNPNVALERSEILSKVWGENYFGDVKIVDVNVRRLRMKIEDEPSSPKYLCTVWGYGYKWTEE